MANEHREFYRLRYPLGLQPYLHVLDDSYVVGEISEKGLRFIAPLHDHFGLGEVVRGSIEFADGEMLRVTATVLRRDEGQVVLSLPTAIPLGRMLTEQRLLRQRKLDLDDEPALAVAGSI